MRGGWKSNSRLRADRRSTKMRLKSVGSGTSPVTLIPELLLIDGRRGVAGRGGGRCAARAAHATARHAGGDDEEPQQEPNGMAMHGLPPSRQEFATRFATGPKCCNRPQVCKETVERGSFRHTRPTSRHGRRAEGKASTRPPACHAGRCRGGMAVACANVRWSARPMPHGAQSARLAERANEQ